jgi:hypothetical protein
MKTGKENGRASAPTGPVEEGFDPGLRAFGSELRALAQAVHPRVDFVTRLRQDMSTALQSPPPAAVPRLALPKWRRTGAALAVVVGLAVVLAFLLLVVLAPWLKARGASPPVANIAHLEIMARVEQLPEGVVTRLDWARP